MTGRVDRRWLSLLAGFVLVCAAWLSVSSARAGEGCANEQARAEQPFGLGLPDCRAFEMVSPLEKSGGDAVTLTDPTFAPIRVRSSVSGEAFTFNSQASFADPLATGFVNQYVVRRGAEGWSTQNLTALVGSDGAEVIVQYPDALFTPDLSEGVLRDGNPPLTGDAPAGYMDYYVAKLSDRSYQTVTNVAPPNLPPDSFGGGRAIAKGQPWVAGASTDLSHVVFVQYANLTPGAPSEAFNIYEWVNGKLSLINVASDGTPIPGGAQPGGGEPYGAIAPGSADVWHAVSADGSRVFFTAQLMDEEEEEAIISYSGEAKAEELYFGGQAVRKPQLYERVLSPSPTTVEVSASQRTVADPNGPQAAFYWGANVDGSRVLFTSRAELTNDANTGGKDDAANLYEYDLETGHLSDLSVDAKPGDVHGAAVLGVAAASEDGSYVYFVAEGELAPGAVSGQPNLYMSHAGSTTFVATLTRSDLHDWAGFDSGGEFSRPAGATNEVGAPQDGPANNTGVRITPDGTRLAFLSSRSLTGYDNEPVESGECEDLYEPGEDFFRYEPGPCAEVYVYDVSAGHVSCVSCDPTGARPIGPSGLGEQRTAFYVPRNFSEDGGRLFFESKDGLVPHDSNGRNDVYEYENGHVYPVSNVAGGQESYFLDATPDGRNVFVATADQLLPEDKDSLVDVYDARVDGGFHVSVPPPVCNNGDSCKPPVSPQPGVFGAPASSTFSGAGNATPEASKPAVKAKKPKLKPKKKKKPKRKKGKRARNSHATRRAVSGGVKR